MSISASSDTIFVQKVGSTNFRHYSYMVFPLPPYAIIIITYYANKAVHHIYTVKKHTQTCNIKFYS